MNCFASFNSSPARSTTEVVPSPTSSSYDCAMSTRVLAAGWIISSISRIVAPSFVIVMALFNLINLSIPLGPIKIIRSAQKIFIPRVVLIISTIASQALILLIIWAFP